MNGQKEALTKATSLNPLIRIVQLSLLVIWKLQGYLNSLSLIANPSLLPLDNIALKIRSSSGIRSAATTGYGYYRISQVPLESTSSCCDAR